MLKAFRSRVEIFHFFPTFRPSGSTNTWHTLPPPVVTCCTKKKEKQTYQKLVKLAPKFCPHFKKASFGLFGRQIHEINPHDLLSPSSVLGEQITSGVHVKRLGEVSMVPVEEVENTIQSALSKISTQLVVYTARNHSHQEEVIYLEGNSTSAMSDSPIALRHNQK